MSYGFVKKQQQNEYMAEYGRWLKVTFKHNKTNHSRMFSLTNELTAKNVEHECLLKLNDTSQSSCLPLISGGG